MRLAQLTAVLILALGIAVVIFIGASSAQAQDIPTLRAIFYQGDVLVAGSPAPDGMQITARIGGSYESDPVTTSSGRYFQLIVGPAQELEGQQVQFVAGGQVIANEVDIFSPSGSLPIQRTRNLSFDSMPVATPTPTVPPAPVIQPAFYSGRVVAGSAVAPDGTMLFARIDNFISEPVPIIGGMYTLVLAPQDESAVGHPVEFYIADVKAFQTVEFQPESFHEGLNLIFPSMPAPTPVPPGTGNGDPDRTPTPQPSPTAQATATATPTPINGDNGTTSGGGCNRNGDAAPNAGLAGLFLLPFLLAAWGRLGRGRNGAGADGD